MHWRNNHLLILLRNRSDTKSPFAFVRWNRGAAGLAGMRRLMSVEYFEQHRRKMVAGSPSPSTSTRPMSKTELLGETIFVTPLWHYPFPARTADQVVAGASPT